MQLVSVIKQYLDVHFLIQTFGYPGVFAIIFAETGLMFGFFLPGDSLLITAGVFAAKGYLDLVILCTVLFLASVLGNGVGYYLGQTLGKRLFNREDSALFHKRHIKEAQAFYEKHGGKTIILARFIPIIRTFAPIVAGITDMNFGIFMLYNLVGAVLWTIGLTLLGFFVGQLIPDKYFEPIILGVIFISLLPAIIHSVNTKEKRANLVRFVTSFLKK